MNENIKKRGMAKRKKSRTLVKASCGSCTLEICGATCPFKKMSATWQAKIFQPMG